MDIIETTTPDYLFSYYENTCGSYEYDDVDLCLGDTSADSAGLKVFETKLQGAVYYEGSGIEGMSVDLSTTVLELFMVQSSTFTNNDVGFAFFESDLASSLYIVNPKTLSIDLTDF